MRIVSLHHLSNVLPRWERSIVACLLSLACFTGCGAKGSDGELAGADTSSHWLMFCSQDADCGSGEQCLCDRCTARCESASDCAAAGTALEVAQSSLACEPVSGCSARAVCQLTCEEDADCPDVAAHCRAGYCEAQGGSQSQDAGASDAAPDGSVPQSTDEACQPSFDNTAGLEELELQGYLGPFAVSSRGVVAVARIDTGGYQIAEFDWSGAPLGTVQEVWVDSTLGDGTVIAVSGDTLALVEQVANDDGRQTCRLGIYELGVGPVMAPSRVSDAPEADNVMNEVLWCQLAETADGFVVLWQQFVDAFSDAQSVFLQHFDREGGQRGDRLLIASGDKRLADMRLFSDGTDARLISAVDGDVQWFVLETDEVRPMALDDDVLDLVGDVLPQVVALDDRALVAAQGGLFVIDYAGHLLSGPVSGEPDLMGPLGEHYVFVEKDEFLKASTLDAQLAHPSQFAGVSVDRAARAEQLVFSRDGKDVALVYAADGQQQFARVRCGEQTSPLGPQPCPERDSVVALDDGCESDVCHALVRLDATTLGLLGYAVVGQDADPVDQSEALAAASDFFDGLEGTYLSGDPTVSGPNAGMYLAFEEPGDFGGFALVSQDGGEVVVSGGIVWSGTGQYWKPTQWLDAVALECGAELAEPMDEHIEAGTCDEEADVPGPAEARDVVLRSNLAQGFVSEGDFSAYTYFYTPSVGSCAIGKAEYVVVLTRTR